MRDWKLEVEFDTLDEQSRRDPENLFPNDETSRFVRHLGEFWGLTVDDLNDPDLIQWSPTQAKVILYPEVLDYISEPMEWLLMHTIPKRIELSR